MYRTILLILLIAATLAGCSTQEQLPSSRVHAFYYPWYGNPEHDGEFVHWRHDILGDEPPFTYPGGDEIGADFYPEGGCYSSGDPAVLHRHMRQLQQARIGVICVSWLGQGSFEAGVLPTLMNIAAEHGIKVNFHLEPAVQQSIRTVREAIVYLIDTYGDHPAFYRAGETGGRGLFYIYDSYRTPAAQWARLLTEEGDLTIRKTPWDAAVVGLLLGESDMVAIETGGFDGGYTYFAVDGFSYGSTTANWERLSNWARRRDLLLIPSVGPGYSDRRIRPWNRRNRRRRNGGDYYDRMFTRAIAAEPAIIGITSFNEWHEGTQIEPAIPFATDRFTYLDYRPLQPDAYLQQTADWIERWGRYRNGSWSPDPLADLSPDTVSHLAVGSDLRLGTSYSTIYAAGGAAALVDGVLGSSDYRDGCWQGYEGVDLMAEIDLGGAEPVAEIRLGFLRDRSVWIFLPRQIRIEGSLDGLTFAELAKSVPTPHGDDTDPLRHEMVIQLSGQQIRFLRITARNVAVCPPGHPGDGGTAWLFCDEIQVLYPTYR